jgi:two-component system, LytTR family, response regulator
MNVDATVLPLVIVEDSRLARAELRTLLAEIGRVRVLAEAADVAGAVAAIDRERPALVLLDIQLPGGSGFDVLDRVEHLPAVVFTTAYDQHAVDAFERSAVDYLLKPIVRERLAQALDKVRTRLALRSAAPAEAAESQTLESSGTGKPLPPPRRGADDMVFVRDGERCWFVRLADISGFESCGNYAQAWFDGQRPLVARTLAQLEERLDPQLFFRASRSHLVNLRFVRAIVPWVNDGYRVTLKDGHEVEVSRRQARQLRERLEL